MSQHHIEKLIYVQQQMIMHITNSVEHLQRALELIHQQESGFQVHEDCSMQDSCIDFGLIEKTEPIRAIRNDGTITFHHNGRLHRVDGPAIEDVNGDREWWQNGQRHRVDGPAVEHTNGYREWWLSGRLHRADGPAVEHTNGSCEWYLNGEFIRCR